jgi:NADPH-dependent curcumin reductase CurA
VALLKQLGFDEAFNYKTTDTAAALKAAAPDGIDVYFDNVGGSTLETVLDQARPHARIVECGMISQYDLPDEKKYGVKNLFNVRFLAEVFGRSAVHTLN